MIFGLSPQVSIPLSRSLYIVSSKSCQPNRNLFGVGTKLEESVFKSNNQINCTVTTRRVKRMD